MNNESLQHSRHRPHDLPNGRLGKKRTQSDFCLLRATVLAMGLMALMLGGAITLLIQQAMAAGTASTVLTLKSRVTHATCDILTTNGLGGVQLISLPVINPTTVGNDEWQSTVTPLNIGVNCSSAPEDGVTLSMRIVPDITDTDYHTAAIASTKFDGTAGPDLFLVDVDNSHQRVPFTPVLARSQADCDRYPAQYCLKMIPLPFSGSYRLPLGVQMVIPVGAKRDEMLRPGLWQATINLDITYQ